MKRYRSLKLEEEMEDWERSRVRTWIKRKPPLAALVDKWLDALLANEKTITLDINIAEKLVVWLEVLAHNAGVSGTVRRHGGAGSDKEARRADSDSDAGPHGDLGDGAGDSLRGAGEAPLRGTEGRGGGTAGAGC